MDLPSLPTDRLYKLQALGGVAMVLASLGWARHTAADIFTRFDTASEQVAQMSEEGRFLARDVTEAQQAPVEWRDSAASLERRRRDLVLRATGEQSRLVGLKRDSENARAEVYAAVLIAIGGAAFATGGFAAWGRAEQRSSDYKT